MSGKRKTLIDRDQLDKINEHLSNRAANDAASSAVSGCLGYAIIAGSVAIGAVWGDVIGYKPIAIGLCVGVVITWIRPIHRNDPTNF